MPESGAAALEHGELSSRALRPQPQTATHEAPNATNEAKAAATPSLSIMIALTHLQAEMTNFDSPPPTPVPVQAPPWKLAPASRLYRRQ